MTKPLAVVTGGAGFIGQHLVRQLLDQDYRVRVLDPKATQAMLPRAAEAIDGSVLDRTLLAQTMVGASEVYHLAGVSHLWAQNPITYAKVNVEGTRQVLQAAQDAGAVKIIVTSSEVILRGWRDPDPGPLNEQVPLPPLDTMAGPYSRSKYQADQVVREAVEAGAPVVSLYPTVPIGRDDWNLTSPTQMLLTFLRRPPPAYLPCKLNLVPVEDVARAHIQAARFAPPGSRYILSGESLSFDRLLAMLSEISGRPMPRRHIPYAVAYAAAYISDQLLARLSGRSPQAPLEGVKLVRYSPAIDNSMAREVLGFRPGPVEPALRRAVAWLADIGQIPPIPQRIA